MKEEQFEVLKVMHETTSRMDLNTFAKKVNLSSDEALQQFQELAKEGYLQKIGKGYAITKKGKSALKAFTPVPQQMVFRFYLGVNQPTDLTSKTLHEFYNAVKQVSVDSLEFHLYRGDFENWLKEACNEPDLAEKVECVRTAGLKGEDARGGLLELLDAKYRIKELL